MQFRKGQSVILKCSGMIMTVGVGRHLHHIIVQKNLFGKIATCALFEIVHSIANHLLKLFLL
jgi:hypothetical protein